MSDIGWLQEVLGKLGDLDHHLSLIVAERVEVVAARK